MTSPQAREAFDLSKESTVTRERYGMTKLGQCCLLARRLIEGGVRFVTINAPLTVFDEITWDIHGSKPFTSIEGMRDIVCPMYDQAYTAAAGRPLASAACSIRLLGRNLAEFPLPRSTSRREAATTGRSCCTVGSAGGGVKEAGQLALEDLIEDPSAGLASSSRRTSRRRSSSLGQPRDQPSRSGRATVPPGRRHWGSEGRSGTVDRRSMSPNRVSWVQPRTGKRSATPARWSERSRSTTRLTAA